MQLTKTFSVYMARQFFLWFCGVFTAMVIITFLLDYIELIRRGGSKLQATLSLLFETIPGIDTSGSVCGLPLGCVLGDPNSIVSDAAESRTKVTKFLIFVFMGHYDFR